MDQPFLQLYIYLLVVLGLCQYLFSKILFGTGIQFLFTGSSRVVGKINYKVCFSFTSVILFILSTPDFYRLSFHTDKVPISLSLFFYLPIIFLLSLYMSKKYGDFAISASKIVDLLACLFALFLIVGHSFYHYGSFFYVNRDVPNLLFITLLFLGLFYLFQWFLYHCFAMLNNPQLISKFFDSLIGQVNMANPVNVKDYIFFLKIFCLIVLCWLPYLYFFYPGILSHDPNLALRQFFKHPTANAAAVVLVDPNNPITNHHPYLHTFILGSFAKLGICSGSFNFGLFLYTLLQVTLSVGAFSLGITYLRRLQVSPRILLLSTAFFSLVPIFPYYAMTVYKDVIYSSFFLFYVLTLYSLLMRGQTSDRLPSVTMVVFFCIASMGLVLFRHNGLHVVIITLVALFFFSSLSKSLLVIVGSVVVTGFVGFNLYYLPYVGVSPGPAREKYSVPFQQTARYVKYYSNNISQEERTAISAILPYDKLGEIYDPQLSDPVKSSFNFLSSRGQFSEYLRAWFVGFTKEPLVYLEATIHNTFLYLYPLEIDWVVISKPDTFLKNLGYEYDPSNANLPLAKRLSAFVKSFIYLPFVGLPINGAFLVWVVMFLLFHAVSNHRRGIILFLIPFIVTILFLFLSPANGHYRYYLPLVFSAPFLFILFIHSFFWDKKNEYRGLPPKD